MNRRQFFQPGQLVQTVAPLFDEMDAQAPADAVHLRFARRAMATMFEVIFPFGMPFAHVVGELALDEIDRVEDLLTVYREHSEMSRLNQRAWRHPVAVSQELFHLLARCRGFWESTEGASDVTLGALIKAWGFFKREGRVPAEAELAQVATRVGMQHVLFDIQRWTIHYERNGMEINLGSVGKGHALDRVVALLRDEWRVPHALLHGGHSSVLAFGHEAKGRDGWTVGLTDPDEPTRRLGVVTLRHRGMATSAATFQHFEHEGRKLGHILDPRTLWPAEGVRLATATAPTAAEADALATAFFILGPEKAEAYCEKHAEIGAIVLAEGSVPSVFGVARHEFR